MTIFEDSGEVKQTKVCVILWSESIGSMKGLTELERRERFVKKAEQLLSGNPDLLQLIKHCLHNLPVRRPLTRDVVGILNRMGAAGKCHQPS